MDFEEKASLRLSLTHLKPNNPPSFMEVFENMSEEHSSSSLEGKAGEGTALGGKHAATVER